MRKIQIPLDSAPEHAAALGRMLGHWAIVEHSLSDVLGALLGIEQSRQQMLFNTFIGLSSKLGLIERLIYSYVIDSPEKEKLLKLVEKASKYNSARNSYVHATWAAGSSGALTKIDTRVPTNKKSRIRPFEEITPANIDAFVQELSLLSGAFQEFQINDFQKIQISVRPLL